MLIASWKDFGVVRWNSSNENNARNKSDSIYTVKNFNKKFGTFSLYSTGFSLRVL